MTKTSLQKKQLADNETQDIRPYTDQDPATTEASGNHICNRSGNLPFAAVLERSLSRRNMIKGSLGTVAAGMVLTSGAAQALSPPPGRDWNDRPGRWRRPLLGFEAIPPSYAGSVTVAEGYTAIPFIPAGTPICPPYPEYLDGGFNTGADQECQVGHHHDGMHYFPLGWGRKGDEHGLLCVNHEYIPIELLHPNGPTVVNGKRTVKDEVRKEVAAHGVSVIEVRKGQGGWEVVRGHYNRRITGTTPMALAGPVRGSDFVKTKYSPDGTMVRGTFNNCAYGHTPWGTYLTCEENWQGYFVNRGEQPREQSRYGVASASTRYGWETVTDEDIYARHDVTPSADSPLDDYRNEVHAFGYVVEIDPRDPHSTPIKRTALGRFRHEGAWIAPARIGQPLTIYMGDDQRFEYIYKFVTKERYFPWTASGRMLDEGTLYVARFNDDGTGEWLALDIDDPDFRVAAEAAGVEFKDQADVLVNTRTAADVVGATPMDRPEWGTVDPKSGEVYMTLTNNSRRSPDDTDGPNPRGPNPYGQIVRWREQGNRNWATRFEWELFVIAGPEEDSRKLDGEPLDESNVFNSPDGLWFDDNGILWIQTDGNQDEPFGNNQMLAADPRTGEIRRFFTGARGCEVTGVITTPDYRTMFVNVQHPGGDWPDGAGARPRSSTVIITRDDGGVIGL